MHRHWAQTFGHELDDAQRALLESPEPEDPIGMELLHAAVDDMDVHFRSLRNSASTTV